MTDSSPAFSDPDAVAGYAERPRRNVPGFEAMQRMAEILFYAALVFRGWVATA